ncbi:hypothetical protein BU26DRAFT_569290 [Trematosphaeria pertusa]|uniref:F-box domain-containing protein n=1 Tax=Trematosphaeria pertusa TaxID=390896 RepID=A0A6A6I2B3_9PLEO|nr:uncharacterized protein BU26DRAFT_569290 [Trematosphaeria pertusa]KAF2244299.1 hypothetical protein BU26DRAFT_569290 [Trematosphaeria pertusa]
MDHHPYLETLPEELLEQIFLNFVPELDEDSDWGDLHTLVTLSSTAKKIHRIIEPLVYGNVPAYLRGSGPYADRPVNAPRLHRTLSNRPFLATHVKSFRAVHSGDSLRPSPSAEDRHRFHEVLKLMPCLERLDMLEGMAEHSFDVWEDYLFGADMETNHLGNLRRLDIAIYSSSVLDLLPIFQLPKLETIHVDFRGQATRSQYWRYNIAVRNLRSTVKKLSVRNVFSPDLDWQTWLHVVVSARLWLLLGSVSLARIV